MYSSSRIKPAFLSRQMSLSHSAVTKAMANRQAAVASLQEQLSTGKRINRASDDPAGFGVAEAMDASIKRYEQYQRTISSARLWIDESESALTGMTDALTSAYEEGIRSINSALSLEDLETVATEIEGLLDTFVDQLNTRAGNEYIFAGARTTTTPFLLDNSATADSSGVTYYGDDRELRRTIGDDLDISINLSGAEVNQLASGGTVTEALAALAAAVRTGDADTITVALETATSARDHVLSLTAGIGNVSQRMQFSEDQLRNTMFVATSRRSGVEDADIAETITELQMEQLRMQAATQALLSIQQLDITNFLN